jgi:6-pyruvoyltetrahydropterin/6-carboxytetrahydropterin synthase
VKISIKPKPVTFQAAHHLPEFCPNIHGHSYSVSVWIEGDPDKRGVIEDFRDIRMVVKNVVRDLDHTNLNDTIENPTAENVALWIWTKVNRRIHDACRGGVRLSRLTLAEGDNVVEIER